MKFLRDSFENDHPRVAMPVDLDNYAPPNPSTRAQDSTRAQEREESLLAKLEHEIGEEAQRAVKECRALVPWQRSPLDVLADHVLALTYGDMIAWTDAVWSGMPEEGVPDAGALAKLLHAWAGKTKEQWQ